MRNSHVRRGFSQECQQVHRTAKKLPRKVQTLAGKVPPIIKLENSLKTIGQEEKLKK